MRNAVLGLRVALGPSEWSLLHDEFNRLFRFPE